MIVVSIVDERARGVGPGCCGLPGQAGQQTRPARRPGRRWAPSQGDRARDHRPRSWWSRTTRRTSNSSATSWTIRRLPGDRATTGEDGARLARGGGAGSDPHGPAAARHRRRGGAAPHPPTAEGERPRPGGDGVRHGRRSKPRTWTAGFDGYVQKPLNVRDLLRQVRDYLEPRAPG